MQFIAQYSCQKANPVTFSLLGAWVLKTIILLNFNVNYYKNKGVTNQNFMSQGVVANNSIIYYFHTYKTVAQ